MHNQGHRNWCLISVFKLSNLTAHGWIFIIECTLAWKESPGFWGTLSVFWEIKQTFLVIIQIMFEKTNANDENESILLTVYCVRILESLLEVLAGERSYSYTLDQRSVRLYLGKAVLFDRASGGTHMERWGRKGTPA